MAEIVVNDGIDTDCNICQTQLKNDEFAKYVVPKPGAIDVEESSEVFRLACGHAFHAVCICRALRVRSACPSCRAEPASGPVEQPPELRRGTTIYMQGFRSSRDVTVDVEVMEDGELDVEIMPEVRERPIVGASYDPSIAAVPAVQRARAALNRSIRLYRRNETTLMKARRDLLTGALRTLRNSHRNAFDCHKNGVQLALQRLRRAESLAAIELGEPFDDTEGLNYDVSSAVGNQNEFGPLKHRFWHN